MLVSSPLSLSSRSTLFGPFQLVAELGSPGEVAKFKTILATVAHQPGVVAVTPPVVSANGKIALAELYPSTSPQAVATSTLLHNLRELPSGKWTWKHDPNRAHPTPESMRARQAEIMNEIAHMTCPTLVLRGAKSDVLTDESAASFASALPDGRWARVENAGHTVQGDNPRGLVETLRPFLREIKL